MPFDQFADSRCSRCGMVSTRHDQDCWKEQVAKLTKERDQFKAAFKGAKKIFDDIEAALPPGEWVSPVDEVKRLTTELERWNGPLTDDQLESICAIADMDRAPEVDVRINSLDIVIRVVRAAGEKRGND